MLHRVRRRWSRSSKSETSVATLDADRGQRLLRTVTLEPEQATDNASKLSLTPSDKALITKLALAPDQPLVVRAPHHHTPFLNTKWSERTVFNNVETGILSLPAEVLLYLQLSPPRPLMLNFTLALSWRPDRK
jgi:hypothetical protein